MSEAKDNSWNFRGARYLKRKVTDHVALGFYKDDVSAYEFGRIMLGKGWFNTGYHYIVHPNMQIEKGIPIEQMGDPSINGWQDSICILAVGVDPKDGQKWKEHVYPWVKRELNLTLPLKE